MQENRFPDPRDEFSDEYKGEYGENERHEEQVVCALTMGRGLNPEIRLAYVRLRLNAGHESIEQCSTQIIGVLSLHCQQALRH